MRPYSVGYINYYNKFCFWCYVAEERMRRAGKNPKRVGADFHLKLASQKQDSDDW